MTTCNCPKCNTISKSVSAMNYAETKVWNKRGRFSGVGVGVGVGTGGIGLGAGIGMGGYKESGTIATKRAAIFDEPIQFKLDKMSINFGVLTIVMLFFLPKMLEQMTIFTGTQANMISSMSMNQLVDIMKYIYPVLALIIGFKIWKDYEKHRVKQDYYDNVIYPKKLAKYQTLRYCEHCHLLIDDKNNMVVANEFGYDKILSM